MDEYLSEFIYGSVDGLITTFSIVAGSAGGNLSQRVIMVLGISNVLSDGYSMGVSRYLSAVAEKEQGLSFHDKPAWVAGFMTFLAFVIVGVLPILPFAFIKKRSHANKVSLGMAMAMFFVVGIIKGWVIEYGKKREERRVDNGNSLDEREMSREARQIDNVNSLDEREKSREADMLSTVPYQKMLRGGGQTLGIGMSAALISYMVGRLF